MNWKTPAFWAGAGTALGAIALSILSSDQVATADQWTGVVGVVAACVLAAAGAFRAGLRRGADKAAASSVAANGPMSVPMTNQTKIDGGH